MSPALCAIADALAVMFSPHLEAVVHDLNADRILHVAGNFSRRRVGDPSLNDIAELQIYEDRLIGPYTKTNWDGRRLKSISVVLRDDANLPTHLMCINLDLSAFEAAKTALGALLQLPEQSQKVETLFPSDWREAANTATADFLAKRNATLAGLDAQSRLELISVLDERGLFAVRGAANYVAEILGCSRATLYKRLNASRVKKERPL